MDFYYSEGHQQKGPVSLEQLREMRLAPDTLVWREGMAQWTRADALPELASVFAPPSAVAPSAPPVQAQAFGQQSGHPHGYPQQQPAYGQPAHPQQPAFPPQPGFPQQPSFQQPMGYAVPPSAGLEPGASDGLGIGSLIVGIIAVLASIFLFCMNWLSLPLAVTAVILGHLGVNNYRRATGRTSGTAVTGLVCGYLAIAITVIMWATIGSIFHTASQKVQQQQQQQQQGRSNSGW